MLFVGCSSCRSVFPLWCTGQFMPHFALAVISNGTGVFCPQCGFLPLIFTCTMCWTRQPLYLSGSNFNPTQFVNTDMRSVGLVVQAEPNRNKNEVHELMKNCAMQFVKEFSNSFAKGIGQSMGTNTASAAQGWFR